MCNPCQTRIFHLSANAWRLSFGGPIGSESRRARAHGCQRKSENKAHKTDERRRQLQLWPLRRNEADNDERAIEWIHGVVTVARPTAKKKAFKFRVRCNMFARKVKLKIFWFLLHHLFNFFFGWLLSNYIFRGVRMAIIAIFTRINEWFCVSRRSLIFLNWSNSLRVCASVRVMMAPFIENCLSQVREQKRSIRIIYLHVNKVRGSDVRHAKMTDIKQSENHMPNDEYTEFDIKYALHFGRCWWMR